MYKHYARSVYMKQTDHLITYNNLSMIYLIYNIIVYLLSTFINKSEFGENI